jgi:choline dehydrogenase-like flavoprotein
MAPLISPRHLGAPFDRGAHSGQLNLVCRDHDAGAYVVGMVYSLDGLLRSDLMFEFPLDARGCLTAARYALPAMMMLQVFHAGVPRPQNHVRLDSSGALVVEFQPHEFNDAERRIIRAFRSVGFLSHSRLLRRAAPGGSVHYGGTLPMRDHPDGRYTTDRDGLLSGSRRVFIGDSASFPTLPAKNLTLTIMSNAMRVAQAALRRQTALV